MKLGDDYRKFEKNVGFFRSKFGNESGNDAAMLCAKSLDASTSIYLTHLIKKSDDLDPFAAAVSNNVSRAQVKSTCEVINRLVVANPQFASLLDSHGHLRK